ncbi:hypothetical protein AADZ90_003700 [Aestuariibius sp. 2305UL40-4]|uniref:hypothetical protein n=1 Tax=Aestuariibius violaceus TaxID=3234132 RepID=UPI00345E29D7
MSKHVIDQTPAPKSEAQAVHFLKQERRARPHPVWKELRRKVSGRGMRRVREFLRIDRRDG